MTTVVNPFTIPGQWYRGNTHSHSTRSDGRLSVEDRFAQYRERGYHFLVLTDHGVVTDVTEHCRPGFLAIAGSELHPPNPYGGDRYHIVGINLSASIPYEERHPNEVLADVRDQGGLAVLCHPYWCGHQLRDLAPLDGYFAVEVYNETCEQLIGKGLSEPHWDDLLDSVGPCAGIAADDAHDAERDVFRAWIMVRAPELTIPAVLRSLRQGAFYSTQGPEILDLRVEETLTTAGRPVPVVCVRTSPARSITFKGQRSRGGRSTPGRPDELITEAEYPVYRGERYIRVEVTAADGNKAWTNPLLF